MINDRLASNTTQNTKHKTQKLKNQQFLLAQATPWLKPSPHTKMSLAEFIAATQAEMKSRIEEECRRQMLALLEDSFSKKWDEYTGKAVTSASAAPLYSEDYGRLDIDSIPTAGDITDTLKTALKAQQALYTFSSKKVYFIHCVTKLTYGSGGGTSMEAYLIDNHGFHYQIGASVSPGSYRHPSAPVKIDITKPVQSAPAEQYIYPLSNALIDIVKAMPYSVTPYRDSNGYGNSSPGGDIQSLIKNLPQIRKAAALFSEQTVALDALKKENAELKARIRAMEAASPSEDLLGLEAALTEPSKTLVDLKPAGE